MAPHIVLDVGGVSKFPAKLTKQVVFCSLIAAFGGLMFGYDIGISGGVTSMDGFLLKFFPNVYEKKHRAKENNYCKYDNQCSNYSRRRSTYRRWCAVGLRRLLVRSMGGRKRCTWRPLRVVLSTAAVDLWMLIAGRIFLGAGVGFGNQAVPLFISEIAPAKYRGGLNVCFQLLITFGILIANLVNYFTSNLHNHGWRISLGGAGFPAVFLFIGSFLIVETPTSLIERGKTDEGLKALRKTRGVEDVQKEYDEIVHATELAKEIKHPFRNLVMKRSSWPQLFCGTVLQIFQQFTGINVIMFYAPVLFQTMGLGGDVSLMSAVITGIINTAATSVAVFGVDKFGRRKLLMQAALQMLISQVAVGAILAHFLKATNVIPKTWAYVVVFFICFFVMGFAWSWGPLGWLIPSEIFPLETRTSGFSFAVSTNMICTFIIAQAFLTMLCRMRSSIFFFFAVWIVVMGSFAAFLLPETKGVPIDEMNEQVWKKHWFWRRFFLDEDDDVVANC